MKNKNIGNVIEKSRGLLVRYYVTLAYVGLFLATIVLSLFSIKFDFVQLKTGTFWGNLCLNYALAIASMILAMYDGEKKKTQSAEFVEGYKAWREKSNKIIMQKQTTILDEYLAYRHDIDQKKFLEEIIARNNLKEDWLNEDFRVLKRDKIKLGITNDQLAVLKRIKDGKYTISTLRSNQLLNASKKTDLHFSYGINIDKARFAADNILPKLVLMFITTSLLVSVVFNTLNKDPGTAVATLALRLLNVALSIFAGYRSGFMLADEELEAYNNRTLLICDFENELELGTFKPSVEPLEVQEEVQPEASPIEEQEEPEYEILEMSPEEFKKLKNPEKSD